MTDLDLSNVEWDDAQFCAHCNKNFLVEGVAPYKRCPDCNGPLTVVSKKQADQIEKILDTFSKTMDGLKIDKQTFQTFQSVVLGEGAGLKKCDECTAVIQGKDVKDECCPSCGGRLRPVDLKDLDIKALSTLPLSPAENITAAGPSSVTHYSLTCPQCGETTTDDTQPKFCSNCGASLQAHPLIRPVHADPSWLNIIFTIIIGLILFLAVMLIIN